MAQVTDGETEAQRGASGNTKVFSLFGVLCSFILSVYPGNSDVSAKTLCQCHLVYGPSTRATGQSASPPLGSRRTQHVSLLIRCSELVPFQDSLKRILNEQEIPRFPQTRIYACYNVAIFIPRLFSTKERNSNRKESGGILFRNNRNNNSTLRRKFEDFTDSPLSLPLHRSVCV